MDSFSQEWGVAPRNEEAIQEVTKHTAQDLKIWWGRGRVLFADPSESSRPLFLIVSISSLVSPTSSVTKPYCGFFEMIITILSCYFDNYTALLLCYPSNLSFPVSRFKGSRGRRGHGITPNAVLGKTETWESSHPQANNRLVTEAELQERRS